MIYLIGLEKSLYQTLFPACVTGNTPKRLLFKVEVDADITVFDPTHANGDVPDALRDATAALVREITEWRLAQYIRRTGIVDGAPRIVCRVSHAGSQPILFLPSRDRVAGIPEGWVDVTADGEPYLANFVKVAVNVMHKKGAEANVLGDVLRKWFGEGAGQPGTSHRGPA